MSREEAINFLRDIRIGIEYLQNRYDTKSGLLRDVTRDADTPSDLTLKEAIVVCIICSCNIFTCDYVI